MNHTLSDSQLEAMIKSAVNSSGPLPPDEKFSQLISALRELQERRKADSEPVFNLLVSQAGYKGQKQGNNFGFTTLDAARELKEGKYLLYCHAQPAPVVLDEMLCEFYEVANWPDLVRELVKHIEQLQDSAKRNVKPWEDTFPATLLPAYIDRIKQADDACRAAMLQAGTLTNEDARQVDELTMWIKRLVRSLKNANSDSKLPREAMDYLTAKGLISVGDILR
ncbi:hypothetical protein ACVTKY_005188 [Klebsiella michiganensis]